MSSGILQDRHRATDAIASIEAGLDELAEASLWSLSAAQIASVVIAMERIARRVAFAQLPLLAQADAVRVGVLEGAPSTPAWLREAADVPIGVGKARLALHEALASRGTTAAAFAAGGISLDGATAVCAALEALPGSVPAALTAEIEQILVDTARDEGTRAVVHRAMEITHRFAPDVLEDAEQRAKERRCLRLIRHHDGTLGLRGRLDKEAGALALAVLDPLAASIPASGGVPDLRSTEQRYADAFTRLCEQASTVAPDVRGERPQVLVTISLDALQRHPATPPGLLDGGAPISAGAARRLACDAQIIPLVLGSVSQPLDIGRATRLIPAAIRRALIARDGGCAFPGCDRPPGWCEAHHRIHWADGGDTAVCNLVLLCGHHHDCVHHDGWTIELIDGRPWFTPPRWIDATRTPRLNSRYRVRQLDP